MNVTVTGFLSGYPQFQPKKVPLALPSLFAENRTICHLRPSSYSQNKIVLTLQQIFTRVLEWLYPVEKTNYAGIAAALDREANWGFEALGREETLLFFKRFFSGESSSKIPACLEELREQYKMVEALEQVKRKNPTQELLEPEKRKVEKFLEKRGEKILRLKEGEQSLILANGERGDELFFLFSKEKGETLFQIIGRGPSMIELSGVGELAVTGRAKIVSYLQYGAVDKEFIREVLQYSPLKKTTRSPEFMALLQGKKVQSDDFSSHLRTKTERLFSLFWTVCKEASPIKGGEEESLRLKIRLEIFTLFSFFKDYRLNTEKSAQDTATLARLFRITAQSLSKACQDGIISEEEVKGCLKELVFIKQALDAASTRQEVPIHKLKMPSMGVYPPQAFRSVPNPVDAAIPTAAAIRPRYPRLAPPNGGLERVAIQEAPKLDLAAPLEEQFAALVEVGNTPQQIVEAIYAIDFSPYEEWGARNNFILRLDPLDRWVTCSPENARAILGHLNTLSERLVHFSVQENELPIDMYEALAKMSCMVAFLSHHIVHQGRFSDDSYRLIHQIVQFQSKLASASCITDFRHGHALHGANVVTNHQMLNFVHQMGGFQRQYLPPGTDIGRYHDLHGDQGDMDHVLRGLPLGFEPLYKQVGYLRHLLPNHNFWRMDDSGSLTSSIYNWIAPLPFPLLSLYHSMRMRAIRSNAPSVKGKGGDSFEGSYRDTPESIQHDPEGALAAFEPMLKGSDMWSWRGRSEAESRALATPAQQEAEKWEPLLVGSSRKKQLKALLKKQEEYLIRAEQMKLPFSKEELTALLSLLREKKPQKEILAFLKTHSYLLSHPAVRSWVQLLFFHPALLETLEHEYRGRHNSFCQLMPKFFAEKIEESMAKVEADPKEMEILLFFIQMSERLKGIYEAFQEKVEPEEKHKYATERFFPLQNGDLKRLLQEYREKDPAALAGIEVIALQLKIYFAQKDFSQKELTEIILDMHQLIKTSGRASGFDYRELFWLKGSYQNLLKQLPNLLDQDHLRYVLDTLCHRSGLTLDDSAWEGQFPLFSNAQYSVNLETGAIIDLVSESMAAPLPAALLATPLYKKSFPELLEKEVKALKVQTKEGVNVYFFNDLNKNRCRVEEREGSYTLYRSFSMPHTSGSKMLQAVELINTSLKEKEAAASNPNKGKLGIFSVLKEVGQNKAPPLPAILSRSIFVDPQNRLLGYSISEQNKVEAEIRFKETKKGLEIESVVDLRGESPSPPMQVLGLSALQKSALEGLEQIEDPAYIIAWGQKGGDVAKIELPRYGLQFAIQEGFLVCTTPKYAGYRAVLRASLEERKGLFFSLLLEHPDRVRPKKLFIAPSHAIEQVKVASHFPVSLASFLLLIEALIFYFRFGRLDGRLFSFQEKLKISSDEAMLTPTVIDLRPHTEELLYTPGKETEESQELIRQWLHLGLEEAACELIRSLPIKKGENELRQWLRFLAFFDGNGVKAAVGLKIAGRLKEVTRGQKKYAGIYKRLQEVECTLFTAYLQAAHKLTSPLKLSKEEFDRIAAALEKRDPRYYERHVAPFFLNVNDPFTLLPQVGRALFREDVEEEEALEEETSKIRQLEEEVRPQIKVERAALTKKLNLLPENIPLLFNEALFAPYFDPKSHFLTRAQDLLKEVVLPKREEIGKEKQEAKRALEALLSSSRDPLLQLSLFAQEKELVSLSDLLLALLQNDFSSISTDSSTTSSIKEAVIRFYDAEVRFHHISRCQEELAKMVKEKEKTPPAIWEARSELIFDMLGYKRQYRLDEYPELLAFEAFHFVTFRNGIEPSQLELLKRLIEEPSSIIQAGTGTGKSSVLSVLRGFMRANGTNLVTQKVLPHLFQETVAILENRLGNLKRKLYPCLFNQSMPLYDKEGNSLFAQIYQNLLETIQNKGCVLTDYKSFPLLEQKFLSLSKQLISNRENGTVSEPILFTHWFYLRKILILLANRDDQLMDEFDQPLSAVQRIQTQMREGPVFETWKIEEAIALYDLLKQDEKLLLLANLQGAVPHEVRAESIKRVARTIAEARARGGATVGRLYAYLTGESEEVLAHLGNWTAEEKDALAFLKEELTVYLPLTLSRSSISHYARAKDGKKVVTCSKGERRDAKFGNPIEEINYTIQDYLQNGVALSVFREWLIDSKQDWIDTPEPAEERFADLLPGVSLAEIAYLPPDDFEDRAVELLQEANRRPEVVLFFLKRHLASLRTSGIVVSMNPQDCVAMSVAVSGVSATAGSLGSLHHQFARDFEARESLQEKLVERLKQRSLKDPIRYDPLKPLEVLKEINDPRFCAIIDGNAAFQSIPPEEVARALLEANPVLKRVEFYDKEGNVGFVGAKEASLGEKGFYFPQAQTRGSDQLLHPQGIALMTASEKGDIEDFIQEEGRMRHPHQKVLVALSSFASENLHTLEDLLAKKEENRKEANKLDRYPAELQRLRQMVRHAAREELLHFNEFEGLEKLLTAKAPPQEIEAELVPFFTRFQQLEPLFIQSVGAEEADPGEFFQKYSPLVPRNADPVEELETFQGSLIAKCEELGISKEALEAYDAAALAPFMPDTVLPLNKAEEEQLEVQEELELNNEFEIEQEQEQEQESQIIRNKVDFYLQRDSNGGKVFPATRLHGAFNPKIALTDAYLPLNRVDPLHKRTPFDDRTYRVGSLLVIYRGYNGGNLEKVVVGDVLDEVDSNEIYLTPHPLQSFYYDLRLGEVTTSLFDVSGVVNTPEFTSLIAQVKFLDGRMDGYSEEELLSLGEWLEESGAEELYHLFNDKILKYRPEKKRFPHSQLWNLFKEKVHE